MVACVVRQHDIEHFLHSAFGYADFFRAFDDIQAPESCLHSGVLALIRKKDGTGVGSSSKPASAFVVE